MHKSSTMAQPDSTRRRKHGWLAVGLNCILPGAGLAYLGLWRRAIINFGVIQLIVVCSFAIGDPKIIEHIHWVLMAVIVWSGAIAHQAAKAQAE